MLACRKNWNSHSGKIFEKVVKWITGNEDTEYKNQLRLLKKLPLPIFIQFNYLLLASKALNEEFNGIELTEVHRKKQGQKIYKMMKTRTEKVRSEFPLKTCRTANCLENLINLREPIGLKNRIKRDKNRIWNFSKKKFALGNCSAIVKTVEIIGHYFNLMIVTLEYSAQL